jgi:hypothetical protein
VRPSCWIPLLPPGNIHVLLRMDLSFPSPPPLPKLFPFENMNRLLFDSGI